MDKMAQAKEAFNLHRDMFASMAGMGYQQLGRGALCLFIEDGEEDIGGYMARANMTELLDGDAIQGSVEDVMTLIDTYKPEYEFVAVILYSGDSDEGSFTDVSAAIFSREADAPARTDC